MVLSVSASIAALVLFALAPGLALPERMLLLDTLLDHYRLTTNDLPGALFTAMTWLALVLGFALYVRAASSANGVLGVTGAALAAFTLVYLMSLVLLLGAEINEIVSRRAGVVQQAGATPRRRRAIAG